jgi:hypothetical protein
MPVKSSYRHRRLVQEQEYTRHAKRIAMEFEADGFRTGPPKIHHTEAVELLLQYTDERERALRSALVIMAADLSAVYTFIDDMTEIPAASGSYARGQQVMVERLRDRMSRDLRSQYETWPARSLADDDVYDVGEPPF